MNGKPSLAKSKQIIMQEKRMRRIKMKHKHSFFPLGQGRAVQGTEGQWERVGNAEEEAEFIFNAKLKAYSVFFPFKNRL